MSGKKYTIIFFALLISAAGLYVTARNYSYVGYFNDDAFYVYAARYFAGLETPPEGKLDFSRPIGYPLLLTPFARLFPQNHSEVFKFLSLLMILAVPVLFFYFLQDIFRYKDTMLLFAALLFFNPYMVRMSAFVISEVPYLLFTVIFIIALKRYLHSVIKKPDIFIVGILILSLITAAIFYLRPQGIALFAGLAIWFLFKKRYRELLYLAFFYLLFISPLFLFRGGGMFIEKYAGEIGFAYDFAGILELFWGNLKFYIENIYLILVIGFLRPLAASAVLKKGLLALFFIAALWIARKPRQRELPEYMRFIRVYILFFLLVHLLWVNQSARYMLPVFIFVIYFILKNLEKNRVLKYIFSVALFLNYAAANTGIVSESLKKNKSSVIYPVETFRWIKENTPEDAFFLSNYIYRLRINTGREADQLIEYSRDGAYYSAHKKDAAYLMYFNPALLQGAVRYNEPAISSLKLITYLRDEKRYYKVYSNSTEHTAVFKPVTSENFVKAWETYREGVRYFNLNRINEAKQKYSEALEIHPDFTAASLELAALYFAEGEDRKANKVINSALEYYSRDGRLWALKGSIYARNDMEKLASNYFETARELAEYFKDIPLLEDIEKNTADFNLTK